MPPFLSTDGAIRQLPDITRPPRTKRWFIREQKPHDEILQRWLAALRDPNIHQCFGAYCRDGKYCATGLLFAIADMTWDDLGQRYGVRFINRIARMNDRGVSLPDIANHVERRLT